MRRMAMAGAAGFLLAVVAARGEAQEGRARVAVVDLGGPVVEAAASDPLSGLLAGGEVETLGQIVRRLDAAAADPAVAGCVLRLRAPLSGDWSALLDLCAAVERLRASGKPVRAYLQEGSPGSYLVASACGHVTLAPLADLWVHGLSSEVLFFRDLLEWAGIGIEAERIGRYKGATEPFTEREATEAYREAMEALLEDLFAQMAAAVAAGRGRDEAWARRALGEGPYAAPEALAAGLVDAVDYEDSFWRAFQEALGRDLEPVERYGCTERARPDFSSLGAAMHTLSEILGPPPGSLPAGTPRVVVVRAEGPITSESPAGPFDGGPAITPGEYVPLLRALRQDDSVRAVVLRIDSPGGGILPSDLIWHELERLSERKPVIASMGGVAASGGYYLAAGCDAIVAHPATITGSIGVLGMRVNLRDLYEKAGLGVSHFGVGDHADWFRSDRPMEDGERDHLRRMIATSYDEFLRRVADARGRTPEEIHEHAQGRVWTGRQALARGLVDRLGGIEEALALARERAGAGADLPVETLPRPRSVLERLSGLEGPGGVVPRGALGIDPFAAAPPATRRTLTEFLLLARERGTLAWMPAAPACR